MGDIELMFLGQYEHTIDEKGRLTIPSRFREVLDSGAYITRGFRNNLVVLTPASFAKMTSDIGDISFTDLKGQDLRRWIFAHAVWAEVDRAGRILIPPFLRNHAQLVNGAIFVGNGDYFEIWSTETWQNHNDSLNLENTIQQFSAFNVRLK